MTTLSVAVRALCEFTAKRGDLDQRFTPSPSSAQGIEGHQTVRKQRAPGYESEIKLEGAHEELWVKGRADGYDPASNRLEEIKTYRGKFESIRAHHQALHWAQAKVYAHLLCEQRGLSQLHIALVYFNVDNQKETLLVETHAASALEQHFHDLCQQYLQWARLEVLHRLARDLALKGLKFPLGKFRPGQRELSVAVYRSATAVDSGNVLLAQAPTGIGKTMGTIFPMLKACSGDGLDKVFFLTAKGTGHELALQALSLVNAQIGDLSQSNVRSITLTSRDKSCEHPDKACHGESCPLAKGFYDRLPQARSDVVETGAWDRPSLRAIAIGHQVCPYYLTQEMVKWADVVIGDYNYFYDSSAMLYAMTNSYQWKIGVLVDESHNLVDRARAMYSAELSQFDLLRAIKSGAGRIKRALTAVNRQWNALNAELDQKYQPLPQLPSELLKALHKTIALIAEANAQDPMLPGDPVLDFYLKALRFEELADEFGEHAIVDVSQAGNLQGERVFSAINIRNVIPALYLKPRHAAAHTSVLFSATLTPWSFYHDMLGLPENWYWLDIPTPFRPEQFRVQVAANLSTRYKDRYASLAGLVEIISEQYKAQPGNYLCFLSSFEYLDMVVQALSRAHPEIPTTRQFKGMDDKSKKDFLDQYTSTSEQVGFAVLGGVFGEGIDLPGQRLIGVFIATLGLPQLNPVNEHILQRAQTTFGKELGYAYTYLYPGLRKVVQAAGRLIRTESDVGVIHLLDHRYQESEIAALLPAIWGVGHVSLHG